MKSSLGLNAELPVLDLLKEAVTLLWSKRSVVVAMFLPVIALLALLDMISTQYFTPADAMLEQGLDVGESLSFGGTQLVFMAVSLVLSVLMATACHRFTLLPPSQWERNALHGFRKGEWRYLWRSMLLGFLCGALIVIGVVIFMVLPPAIMPLGILLSVIAVIYVFSRLAITLPEIALGVFSPLSRAWQLSEGNGGRLMLVMIVVPVALCLPFLLLFALDSTLINYVATMGIYLATLVAIVLQSLSYRFLLSFYEPDNPLLQEIAAVPTSLDA
ncbi:MAG: hypothetical protein IBX52_07125 [Bacterioplanes sp.]|nr:hypothetical protein [Bacterioplanes sp.]